MPHAPPCPDRIARSALGCVLIAACCIILRAGDAAAFCGFFVSSADGALHNSASHVVLLRSGSRTVMTMSNNYQGPPQDFAMVVPVPVVLQKEQVRTLEPSLLRRIDQLSAPRLVEYWEQDPCAPPAPYGGIGIGGLGTLGKGAGSGGVGYGRGYGVTIEARFAVGEYEVLILSAKESSGLEAWLRDHRYNIPAGAAEALAPYIRDQMKFFVAKVDIKRVKRDEHGVVVLSPLRFSYEAQELRLPVRLGLLNASGKQDLLVYILHPGRRFEVANYENAFIPTNVEVADAVRRDFPSFYAELFDRVMAQRGGKAVITEYAWDTRSCDPCPTPPLSESDLLTLGDDEQQQGGALRSILTLGQVTASGPLDVEIVRRVLRRHSAELSACHEKALQQDRSVAGVLQLSYTISQDGQVTAARIDTASGSPVVDQCVLAAARRWRFPAAVGQTEARAALRLGTGQMGRPGGGRSFVLTRLHTRYDRAALSEDLLFREAQPVWGGRATFGGGLGDQGAQVRKDGVNQFQARYIIRHYWDKPVACKEPRYGIWGGPPGQPYGGLGGGLGGGGGQATAATGLASAARGKVRLDKVVRSAVPELGLPARPHPLRPHEKRP
jgi:TonB family protein